MIFLDWLKSIWLQHEQKTPYPIKVNKPNY